MTSLLFLLAILVAGAAAINDDEWPKPVDTDKTGGFVAYNYTRVTDWRGTLMECGLGNDFLIQNKEAMAYRTWWVGHFKNEGSNWSEEGLRFYNLAGKDVKVSCVQGPAPNGCRAGRFNDNMVTGTPSLYLGNKFECASGYRISITNPWGGAEQRKGTILYCTPGSWLGAPSTWTLTDGTNSTWTDAAPYVACVKVRNSNHSTARIIISPSLRRGKCRLREPASTHVNRMISAPTSPFSNARLMGKKIISETCIVAKLIYRKTVPQKKAGKYNIWCRAGAWIMEYNPYGLLVLEAACV